MERPKPRSRVIALLLVGTVGFGLACGKSTNNDDPTEPSTNSATNSGTVGEDGRTDPLSCTAPWSGRVATPTAQESGVYSAEYVLDREEDEVVYRFLDADDEEVATLQMRVDDPDGGDDVTPIWTLTAPDGFTTTLYGRYFAPPTEDRALVRTFVDHGDDRPYEIWSWVSDSHQELDQLWLTAAEDGAGPDRSNAYFANGARYEVLELVDRAQPTTDEAEIDAWVSHYDIDARLGRSAGVALRAFFDPVLVSRVRDHATKCFTELYESTPRALLPGCPAALPNAASNCTPLNDAVSTILAVTSIVVGAQSLLLGGLTLPKVVANMDEAVGNVLPLMLDLVNWTLSTIKGVPSPGDVIDAIGAGLDNLAALGSFIWDALNAAINGDPHIRTLDGLAFDFQGVGEFTAIEAPGADPITVQTRLAPLGEAACTDVSIITAVALRYNGQTIELRRILGQENVFLVDGVQVDSLEGRLAVPEGGSFYESPSRVILGWPDGSVVELRGYSYRSNIDLRATLAPGRAGTSSGLLGNFNGIWDDEPMMPDGTAFRGGMTLNTLYDVYGAAWRVTEENSLFTYENDDGPDSFYNPDFPTFAADANDLDRDRYERARQVCIDAGVESSEWLDACILDVACTEDDSYADALATLAPAAGRLQLLDEEITVDGSLRVTGVPASVLHNDFESDREILVFPETGVTLPVALPVDRSSPGAIAGESDLESAEIPAGTRIETYFAHVDPTAPVEVEGSITFPTEVLGVIVSSTGLESSDALVGARGTVYPRSDRALELGMDTITLSDDRRTVEIRLAEGESIDQLRIVTTGGEP